MENEPHTAGGILARWKCPALAFLALLLGAVALQESHTNALKEAEIQGSLRVLAKFHVARARNELESHDDQYLAELERFSEQNSDLLYVAKYRDFCEKLVHSDSAERRKGNR